MQYGRAEGKDFCASLRLFATWVVARDGGNEPATIVHGIISRSVRSSTKAGWASRSSPRLATRFSSCLTTSEQPWSARATTSPPNRFESLRRETDVDQLAADDELLAARRAVPTEFLPDNSQSILATNDSPDIGFRYSINAYRGCEHGSPIATRPSHEYLGLNAGLDFETKVMVNTSAGPCCASAVKAELARRNDHDVGRYGLLSTDRAETATDAQPVGSRARGAAVLRPYHEECARHARSRYSRRHGPAESRACAYQCHDARQRPGGHARTAARRGLRRDWPRFVAWPMPGCRSG